MGAAMAGADRIKRRLLREAVRENLAVINGESPAARRMRREASRRWLRRSLLLLVPAAFLGSLLVVGWATGLDPAWVLGTGKPDGRNPGTAEVVPLVPPPTGVAAEREGLAAGQRFGPPAPLDRAALPLPVRTIILDPGHGGHDAGTVGPGNLVEKEIALDVALRLRNLLADQGFAVLMTRERDAAVQLDQRAAFANASAGDLFMSIHVNWIPNQRARGIETYYLGPTDDPFLTQLAAAENRESGYSLSDLKRLLEGIYADIRRDESRRLAEAVNRKLFQSLSLANPRLADRGVKQAPFVVLVATEMPAVLVEVSCLSHQDEARLLADPGYRHLIARALFAGIIDYARTQTAERGSQLHD